ncbi:histidinol-phosphatase HisJ [Lentilactobacillus buchneri]|uniref:histidinol-phosphatase HisJ n=1 Tax=Lentilactobacillus buchneri TaxID=1581 RepID=UPI000307856C|nr:histidinol-phosphatase HisJ [Lentilactobacillus buchneri]MCT3543344.1 histidinol-phosphatase HisJ [Lentilactobacillus buchneri]MCT3544034.1 histidinol-phosphatase HisJ [Lentilactobacillus buchneri]MCT3552505.1 histidinol-phosphatase HisJ [Lentilactobacillus buchneri]TJX99826.1 histidinol-phosphatase HisJ [Lentilactobacillus buchneri]
MVIVIKREGHSHTEFCPHGSGDDVELMIQKAIKLGFQEYSITEHAPLPDGLADKYAGKTTGLTEASMAATDLDAYFQKANQMKAKYADQIKINIGFEVDFLPDFVDWTRDFLNEYGPQTTDNILSVHFMQGANDKFWCVDDTVGDFQAGLLNQCPDSQVLYEHYFQTVLASVNADLGPYTPNRIGHMTLIKKFQDYFGLDRHFSEDNLRLVDQILKAVSGQHRELDLNAAGLYKPYCNEQYPSYSVIQMAKSLNIPFVYGSDAHSIAEVGQGYNGVISLVE